jgi:murein DD-endopeptidase MepM/ murein hydrolase activator NlpD
LLQGKYLFQSRCLLQSRCLGLPSLILFLLLSFSLSLFAEYPEIGRLNRDDVLFTQLQKDIEAFYRAEARDTRKGMPALTFYQYTRREGEDLLFMAARLNLPYETLATLNRIETKEAFDTLQTVLLPNLPGVFLPVDPKSDLERIMYSWRIVDRAQPIAAIVRSERGETEYLFYPGDRFHPIERAYFLQILFRLPLRGARLTSGFGMRRDPFGGHPRFHSGIDLVAERGAEVLAAREGNVSETGFNRVYGNYILISHNNGYETLYGHLGAIEVRLNQWVNSGSIIGRVGSTGLSTGPHLHFEIRRKGVAKDPLLLLPYGRNRGE